MVWRNTTKWLPDLKHQQQDIRYKIFFPDVDLPYIHSKHIINCRKTYFIEKGCIYNDESSPIPLQLVNFIATSLARLNCPDVLSLT